MNITILSCGPGLKEIVNVYGHSSEWIPNAINNSSISFTVNKVYENDFSNINNADAYIITGSKYSVYDEIDWIEKLKNITKNLIKSNTSGSIEIFFKVVAPFANTDARIKFDVPVTLTLGK